jgi:DNA-binding GntR family transcriptional regulator
MAEYAAAQIREAIIAGHYQPGDRLIEIDLAQQLQVSRHPVREALRRLDREGFVAVRANRGAVVADVGAASILEVYEIRAALGALALRHLLLGRHGPSPEYLKKLEQLAEKARYHAAKDSQKEMIKYDLLFQATIVEASGLSRIATYFRELNAEIERFNNYFKIDYPDKVATIDRHLFGILRAIRAANLVEAEQIWQDKFITAATRFMAHVPDADEYRARDPSWLLFAAGHPTTTKALQPLPSPAGALSAAAVATGQRKSANPLRAERRRVRRNSRQERA